MIVIIIHAKNIIYLKMQAENLGFGLYYMPKCIS